MRILVISQWYPTENTPTSGIFVHELVKATVDQGIEVKVLSGFPHRINFKENHNVIPDLLKYKKILKNQVWDKYEGISCFRIPFITGIPYFCCPILYRFSIMRIISHIRKVYPFDLVHAHTAFLDGTAAIAIKKKYNVPVFLTEHTGPFSLYTDSFLKRKQTEYVFNNADKIFAVSTSLKQQILSQINFKRSESSIKIIGNGVNVDFFKPNAPLLDKKSYIQALWIGHYMRQKRIDRLIDAFAIAYKKHPQLKLHLVGSGPLEEAIRKQINQYNLINSITMTPLTSRAGVVGFLNHCDFLVVSSEIETFSVTTIEALSIGKPVLSTACGGPEDIINSQELGLIVENSTNGLTQGLIDICDKLAVFNPQNIRNYAVSKYALTQLAQTMIEEYKSVIKEPVSTHEDRAIE